MPAKSSSSALLKIGVALAVLAALAAAVLYYSRPVATVAQVVKGRAINAVPGSVTVYAEYEMVLKSEVGGRLVRSILDPGLVVKEGDFLAQIDPGDLDLEIERIQSEYEAHKRRLAVGSSIKLDMQNAQDDLKNAERLFKLGSLSESELTRQQRNVQTIQQRVDLEAVENQLKTDNYENTLKTKKRQREKMTITAPFDGVVSVVNARPGDLIGSNLPIANLISTMRTVEAKISEENFAPLRLGQTASVRFLGYGDTQYRATVDKILPTADPTTQRYIIHLTVDMPLDKLVPGLTGEASIIISQREAEATIPRRALRGNEVYVVSGGKVEARRVQLGFVALNQAEVLGGLKPGELVVVEELDVFRPGTRVRTNVLK